VHKANDHKVFTGDGFPGAGICSAARACSILHLLAAAVTYAMVHTTNTLEAVA